MQSTRSTNRREAVITTTCLAVTLACFYLAMRSIGAQIEATPSFDWRADLEVALFCAAATFLAYGGIVYQLCRLGSFTRPPEEGAATQVELEAVYDRTDPPSVLFLVPSYKEDERIVWQTLVSAALVEHRRRRIVLLLDDPPAPRDAADQERLAAARALPTALDGRFRAMALPFVAARDAFHLRRAADGIDREAESARLAALYRAAARDVERLADVYRAARGEAPLDHTDEFFLKHVIAGPASRHRARAEELARAPADASAIARHYTRLAELFSIEIASFERKLFANLSQESNKAMNLNSYLALVGGSFRHDARGGAVHLVPCAPGETPDLRVPSANFVVTLDADSLLLSDYALRLIHVMEKPGNERIAVAQTPYSAIPGAPNLLERVAGATTDIQHIQHQGAGAFGAEYWVGANAILRHEALLDIVEETEERGHRVKVFIQDRTVIEDTGSTIDLVHRGWRLFNYPARLAYSATPPDFGSLLIQRRRWANGGLIILPSLLRYVFARWNFTDRPMEAFVRAHYLLSPALGTLSLFVLLFYPFGDRVATMWLPLSALPYYALYTRDLRACGYRASDMFRVYALNLLLVAVQAGGVLKSIQQAITGRKTPFGRTPKIADRTATPRVYVAAQILITAYCCLGLFVDLGAGRYAHALFGATTGVMFVYAIHRFMGMRASLADLTRGTRAAITVRQWRQIPL